MIMLSRMLLCALAAVTTSAAGPAYELLAGAEAMYELPATSPTAVLFLAHGCQHSATDFWAPTSAAPQCLGLPEEVRIVKSALRAGFAVIAISSQDRLISRCWDIDTDGPIVQKALTAFREQHNLAALPLVALGASSGGAFVLLLAGTVRFRAVISQIMAVPPPMLPEPMPPTLFVHMLRDQRTASMVNKCVRKLRNSSGAAAGSGQLEVRAQKPTAAFFTKRIEGLTHATATELHEALRRHKLLDADGYLAADPRGSPWRAAIRATPGLAEKLPGPGGGAKADSLVPDASAVAEALNVAWAAHEIVSDGIDVMLQFALNGSLKGGAGTGGLVEGARRSLRAQHELRR